MLTWRHIAAVFETFGGRLLSFEAGPARIWVCTDSAVVGLRNSKTSANLLSRELMGGIYQRVGFKVNERVAIVAMDTIRFL